MAVLMSVWGPALRPSASAMFGAGLLSGLMGTLTAVGAPPFALALQRAPAAELRATMNAVLLLGACISMASLAMFGAFGVADILRGAAMLPAVLLGFLLARFVIRGRRTERVLRPAVLTICTMTSLVLLGRALSRIV